MGRGRAEAVRGWGEPDGAPSRRVRRVRRARGPLLGLGLLSACITASLLSVPHLPTHDGPQHVFAVHAASHIDAAGTGWSRWFEPNVPVTSHGFGAIFGPLDLWLPWPVALRLALVVMALAWAAGAFALARAVHPERAWLGVALAAGALQWSLYMGLFSFHVATAFGLFLLAIAFGAPRWGRGHRVLLSLLLLLQAALHVMPAILTGLVLAILAWLRAAPGRRLREALSLVLMGMPAALVLLAVAVIRFTTLADELPQAAAGERGAAPWWVLGRCFLGGPAWRAWPLTLFAAAAPIAALVVRGRRTTAEDRALLVAGAGLLVAGVATPLHLPTWDYFSVRFLPLGICLLALAWPLEAMPARRWVAAAAALFAFAATGWTFSYHRDLAGRAAGALAGLDADIRRDGPRLPVVVDPKMRGAGDPEDAPMPFTAPLLNLGKLYATSQGGFVPFSFSSDPGIHSLLMREEARPHVPAAADPRFVTELEDPAHAGDLALREAVIAYLVAHGTRYQDVIFFGEPRDADYLVWLGFEPDWRRDGLVIARFRGCPLTIVLRGGAESGPEGMLELGWLPALGVTHRYPLARARPRQGGGRALPVRQSCGAVWIRPEDPGWTCAGADAERRLAIPSTRETTEVACDLRRSATRAARQARGSAAGS